MVVMVTGGSNSARAVFLMVLRCDRQTSQVLRVYNTTWYRENTMGTIKFVR